MRWTRSDTQEANGLRDGYALENIKRRILCNPFKYIKYFYALSSQNADSDFSYTHKNVCIVKT